MNFDEYQTRSRATAVYPGKDGVQGLTYVTLGLTGESGEVAEKVKKILRDANGTVSEQTRDAILKELGDVLWYLAQVATELKSSLDVVANANLVKLADRQARLVLKGSGDNR